MFIERKPLSKTRTKKSLHVCFQLPRSDRVLDLLAVSIAGDGGILAVPQVLASNEWSYAAYALNREAPVEKCFVPTSEIYASDAALKLHYHRSGIVEIKPQQPLPGLAAAHSVRLQGAPIGEGITKQVFSFCVSDLRRFPSRPVDGVSGPYLRWWTDRRKRPRALSVAGVLHEGEDAERLRRELRSDGRFSYLMDASGGVVRTVDLETLGVPSLMSLRVQSLSRRPIKGAAWCTLAGFCNSGKAPVTKFIGATIGHGGPSVGILGPEWLEDSAVNLGVGQAYEVVRDRFGREISREQIEYI